MVVVILGMLIGVVAIGLFIRTIVKKRGWKVLSGVFGSIGILVVGFIVFIIGAGIGTTNEVEVELKEWEVNVHPAAVKSGYHAFENFALLHVQHIIFEITNTGSMTHEFVVVRTKAAPDDLPIEGDRVRYYTYESENESEPRMYFHTAAAWPILAGPTLPPREIDPSLDPGIPITPGETKSLKITCGKRACSPGTNYVLFSNRPGDYERGMYAGFIVTDPPFLNTYWWVVLTSVIVVGLLIYFLLIRVRHHV